MKKIVITAAALAALGTTSFAADLPARMPVKVMPAPVVMSWTGCYLGAGAGYTVRNQDITERDTITGAAVANNQTLGGRGWFGTVQGGCDYQFDPNWVVGAFADGNWGSVRGDLGTLNFAIIGREKETSKWAAGGRLGYVVMPKLLAFVSAGWTEAQYGAVNFSGVLGGPTTFTMASRNYNGWFLGSGYEYALTWLPGLYWKTEYRLSEFGAKSNNIVSVAGAPLVTISSKNYEQEIRSELVWRFNSWVH